MLRGFSLNIESSRSSAAPAALPPREEHPYGPIKTGGQWVDCLYPPASGKTVRWSRRSWIPDDLPDAGVVVRSGEALVEWTTYQLGYLSSYHDLEVCL